MPTGMFLQAIGLNELLVDLATAGPEAAGKVEVAMSKTGSDIEATAKRLVPVDTGATRASIHTDTTRAGSTITVEVGPTTHYAPHLEYGTSRMPPHAFMGPALDRHAPDLEKAVAEAGDI